MPLVFTKKSHRGWGGIQQCKFLASREPLHKSEILCLRKASKENRGKPDLSCRPSSRLPLGRLEKGDFREAQRRQQVFLRGEGERLRKHLSG